MASDADLRLGRLAVRHGLVTEEQVLAALHERNRAKAPTSLGAQLVALGLIKANDLAQLEAAVARGEGAPTSRERADQSTDHEISLSGARETIARDQLQTALKRAAFDKKGALAELERLAREFQDTESGVKAGIEARRLRD